MHNSLIENIKTIENKWLPALSNGIETIFSDTFLPSHDLQHHLRVWKFAKDLLIAYENHNFFFSEEQIEALMVAVFFHDTGLTKTLDSAHGEAGFLIAQKFIEDLKGTWNNAFTHEMFEAIIKHDDKEYSRITNGIIAPGIYQILTIADDIDALGCLGLVRYFEIYIYRNIPETEILQKIKANISSRFDFISKQISLLTELLLLQQTRFEKSIYYLNHLKNSEILELKEIIDNKIDPLTINSQTIRCNYLAKLIFEAQEEILNG
jgi:HD superfamily phosphodiesterase